MPRTLDAMCPMLPLPRALQSSALSACLLLDSPTSQDSKGFNGLSGEHLPLPLSQQTDQRAPLNHSAWALQTFTLLRGRGTGLWVLGSGFTVQAAPLLFSPAGEAENIAYYLPCLALPCIWLPHTSMRVHSKSYEKILNHFGFRFKNYIVSKINA